MHHKIAMTIITLSLGACFILTPPPASWAQGAGGGGAAPQGSSGGTVAPRKSGTTHAVTPRATRTVTPRATRTVTPRATRTVTPRATRTVTPRTTRTVTQPKATSRVVKQPKATSRIVTQPKSTLRTVKQPKGTSKVVGPAGTRSKVVSPTITPRVVTPRGTRTVTASRLRGVPARGAGRAVIAGHNYSTWRSGHRVRHGGGWWTFGALSALGAIMIGSDQYYPYAYISAPENYCEGLTEDGCELMWQDVETIEGDVVPQCVAYCPWQ